MAERLEQPVQKDLGLALLIAGNVLLRPAHKLSQFFLTRHEALFYRVGGAGVSNENSPEPAKEVHPKPGTCEVFARNKPRGWEALR